MKEIKKAIAPSGVESYSSYLTSNKEYDIISSDEKTFIIMDDENDLLTCAFNNCAHLPYGESWIITK